MKLFRYGSIAAAVLVLNALAGAQTSRDLVVHEWGTFLAMQGSDGVSLDGMYHEEHALPEFVHSRGRDQLQLPSALVKGETPVIYFYTPRQQRAQVRVDFPTGIWTQWYPQAEFVGPGLAQTHTPASPRNGHISWNADIIPAGSPPPDGYPATSPGALWNHARAVDAAWVRTNDKTRSNRSETDRFLFYRGLGSAPLPITMTAEGNGTLRWTDPRYPGARHIFVLRVENGRAAYRYLPALGGGRPLTDIVPSMRGALSLRQFGDRIADDLAGRLVESGLYDKEAQAMVHTWRSSYFETDGVRVLFVLPQEWTDRFIPLTITPAPREIVRVMVGRLELLTPERERLAEAALKELASQDTATRERAFETLREQGRYVEPIVRRILRTSTHEQTRTLCRRLLLTGFVTELRSALSGAPGRPEGEGQLYVRAQLASLLREMGLNTQARSEALPVLTHLRKIPEPPIEKSSSRHYFRAYARAVEGAGDIGGAVTAYEKFVRFGSQVKRCGGCHHEEGPRNMAWFRDWYAGRKLSELAHQSGATARMIRENEARLSRDPADTGAQMVLAYLYEGRKDQSKADRMWSRIDPPTRVVHR